MLGRMGFGARAIGPITLWSALVAVAPAEQAHAARLALLIATGDKVAGADLATSVVQALLEHTAYELVTTDAMPVDRTMADLRACAGTPECFAQLARATSVEFDVLLVLAADRIDNAWLLSCRKISVTPAGIEQLKLVAIPADGPEEPLLSLVPKVLSSVLGDDWGAVGSISFAITPERAEASIGGRACVAPCRLERLATGDYLADISASGFEPSRLPVIVRRGETTRVEVALNPQRSSILESPWFWTIAGAVTVGTVVSVVALSSSGPKSVCFALDPARCP